MDGSQYFLNHKFVWKTRKNALIPIGQPTRGTARAKRWKKLNIDVVLECTGVFTRTQDLKKHASAGAKHVILSAPLKDEETISVVHGVNDPAEPPRIISCASCTTNCIAPVMEVIDRHIGVKKALMTTVHAYTSTQAIVDGPNKKWPRGRAGAVNLVPT